MANDSAEPTGSAFSSVKVGIWRYPYAMSIGTLKSVEALGIDEECVNSLKLVSREQEFTIAARDIDVRKFDLATKRIPQSSVFKGNLSSVR